jgi:hypothetical protein
VERDTRRTYFAAASSVPRTQMEFKWGQTPFRICEMGSDPFSLFGLMGNEKGREPLFAALHKRMMRA